MSVKYLPMRYYADYLKKMIADKKSFKLETTNYTKKVKKGDDSLLFNDEGQGDQGVLSLISMVRSDAKDYLAKNKLPEDINPKYFDLVERPPETEITKVDVRGAYWSYAMQKGIIKEKTNQFLHEKYDKSESLKKARLKALGSLATCKKYFSYINGEQIEYEERLQETYELYLFICEGIDQMMRDITMQIDGAFYYYWDCIFCRREVTKQVIDYIKSKKYMVSVGETSIETVKIGNNKFLFCNADSKMYMIRQEQEFMLNVVKKEYSDIYHKNGQLILL